jgi:hypothetical protein
MKESLNPNYALGFDRELHNRDAERLEVFAVHTNCGMDKKPEPEATAERPPERRLPLRQA